MDFLKMQVVRNHFTYNYHFTYILEYLALLAVGALPNTIDSDNRVCKQVCIIQNNIRFCWAMLRSRPISTPNTTMSNKANNFAPRTANNFI